MRPLTYKESFTIDLPPDMLWEHLSNVDIVNQLASFPPVTYEYAVDEGGNPLVYGNAKFGPIPVRWQEYTARWTEGEYYILNRRFENGPVKTLRSRMDLAPGEEPDTTVVTQQVDLLPRGWLSYVITKKIMIKNLAKGYRRAYEAAKDWALSQLAPQEGLAVSRATHKHELMLRQRLSLAAKESEPKLIKQLTNHLMSAVDQELTRLRPYRLAKQWDEERDEVLKLFLNATKDGVFDLKWNILCPSWRRGNAHFSSLRELPNSGHCTACNIQYNADFDRSVEVTFSPQPLGLGEERIEYCFASPGNTPHRLVSWGLAAGESAQEHVQLDPGAYEFLVPGVGGGLFFKVLPDEDGDGDALETESEPRDASGSAYFSLEIDDEGVSGIPHRIKARDLYFTITNQTDAERTAFIVRTEWADDVVTAADVTALQEFREHFGSEVLAPGAEFSIRNMVFLFSDLVDSTAMYERVGDAAAFALVRDHFDVLEEVYSKYRGALVKTIGDAVMAVFRKPEDAMQAAVEMHHVAQEMRDKHGERPIALKIGLHLGPCIAMQANDRLDYFGTTVNKSARVQGVAKANEVAMSHELMNDRRVQAWLRKNQLEPEKTLHTLKGLAGENAIYMIRVDRAPKKNTGELTRVHKRRDDRSRIFGKLTTVQRREQ